jgi:glutamate-1-semialdehyde 2,1-aminomutase
MFGGPDGPTHFTRSRGARVVLSDGRELLDWTMALGAVGLGYAHPGVVEAASRAAREGGVGPLPPTAEVELAERLVAVYPGAERARFFKTGAEAVAAAVRIARVATGRRLVVNCGYQGWLDGATAGPGVPAAVAQLWRAVAFDEVAELEAACRSEAPAAIVLEPVVERAPSAAWLEAARGLADRSGAVLVFDEIKTAFRLARGGAAERWGVRPDLAVLGKALANGFPLAAVVGRADLMARCRDSWISSTLATEAVAMAAAGAVLDVWDERDVGAHLRRVGSALRAALAPALAGAAQLRGLDEMPFLEFDDPAVERAFLLGCAREGVLLKRGAYNFPSLAHEEEDVARTAEAARRARESA